MVRDRQTIALNEASMERQRERKMESHKVAAKQKVETACCKSNVRWEKEGPALGKSRLFASLKPREEGAGLRKWSG